MAGCGNHLFGRRNPHPDEGLVMKDLAQQNRRRRAIREAAKTTTMVLLPVFLLLLCIWMIVAVGIAIEGA
jgi:hypothetical protein